MVARLSAPETGWRRLERLRARLPRLLREARARPAWLLLFVFGRMPLARALVARRAAAGIPAPVQVPAAEALAPLDPGEAVARLRRDGLVTGLRLPPEVTAAIRHHAETTPCSGGADWATPFHPADQPAAERRLGRALLTGAVPHPERHCPAVEALLRNRWLHAVAAGYLGAAPRRVDVRLWWSFPSALAQRTDLGLAAQDTFHFDLGDWRQVKAFFYVTDVGPWNGPHLYVRGSHRRRGLADQFPLFVARPERAILAAHGVAAIERVTGPAGSGFIEDPFGYHTGTRVQEGRRLILEISFGITPRPRDPAPDQARGRGGRRAAAVARR